MGDDSFDCLFQQPTNREYMLRQNLLGRMWREGSWTLEAEHAANVYFSLREVDLEKADGTPLWNPAKLKNHKLTWKEFLDGWHTIFPPEIGDLLNEKALEVAPDWNPRRAVTEEGSFQEWPGVTEPPEEAT